MPSIAVLDIAGKEVGSIELPDSIFSITPNNSVMHDVVVNHLANMRQGTQSALTRSEVSGGGRKPWRQKGTGHARQGSTRSPQWRGGGIVFGPTPRSYSKKQNRKERVLALKSALSYKVKDSSLVVLDNLNIETSKTKDMINILEAIKATKNILIVVNDLTDNVILSTRNIPNVVLLRNDEINTLDIIAADTLVITEDAVKSIEEVLA